MSPVSRRAFLLSTAGGLISSSSSARTGGKTGFVFHPDYLDRIKPPGHPESPQRLEAVVQELTRSGVMDLVTPIAPREEVESDIRRIHSDRHIKAIQRIPVTGTVARLAVGGTLAAVDAVMRGEVTNAFCALRPPGHHARNTGREEGFCCFNNVAIAARHIQQFPQMNRVLIVDWDYHHGNATEEAFYDDPTVLFFSTHNMRVYPGTGHPSRKGVGRGVGYNINVHLRCGTSDAQMYEAFDKYLLPAAHRFKPDFVLISAGFDSRKDDPLGCFEVTDIGFMNLTRTVMQIAARHCDGRLVSVLEGGYNPRGTALAATAHIRALLEA